MGAFRRRGDLVIFSQGDVIELDFDPTKGHEPSKVRPALVVSSYDFNISNSMTVVCPITCRMKPFFLHQELPEDCCIRGSVVMEQLRAVDLEARNARRIGSLSEEELRPILVCIQSFFDMD